MYEEPQIFKHTNHSIVGLSVIKGKHSSGRSGNQFCVSSHRSVLAIASLSLSHDLARSMGHHIHGYVPYFFAYKTVFVSFQNNPKNLDPSYKTDLDLWDCLGRIKPVLQQNCIGLI